MYRLLLVTDQTEIEDTFDRIDWEAYGFRNPRHATTVQAAIEIMENHRLDAIALQLPRDQTLLLKAWLMTNRPYVSIVRAYADLDKAVQTAQMVSSFIGKLKEDYSNDGISLAERMTIRRHAFLRALLSGEIRNADAVRSQLMLLCSRIDMDQPCVVIDLELTDGDRFFSERWHYGNERLEVALRNFMGAEYEGLKMVVSVLEDQRVRLLCCPMVGESVDAESITAKVTEHTEAAIEDIRQYLDMELHIANVTVLRDLAVLAAE